MARERRKVRTGRVVSAKMEKTVVVVVESRKPHPLYRRIVKSSKRYMVHNEEDRAKLGDLVQIVESRPYSKLKRWRIAAVMIKGDVADLQPKDIAVVDTQGSVSPGGPAVAAVEEPIVAAVAVVEPATVPDVEVEQAVEPEAVAAEITTEVTIAVAQPVEPIAAASHEVAEASAGAAAAVAEDVVEAVTPAPEVRVPRTRTRRAAAATPEAGPSEEKDQTAE